MICGAQKTFAKVLKWLPKNNKYVWKPSPTKGKSGKIAKNRQISPKSLKITEISQKKTNILKYI